MIWPLGSILRKHFLLALTSLHSNLPQRTPNKRGWIRLVRNNYRNTPPSNIWIHSYTGGEIQCFGGGLLQDTGNSCDSGWSSGCRHQSLLSNTTAVGPWWAAVAPASQHRPPQTHLHAPPRNPNTTCITIINTSITVFCLWLSVLHRLWFCQRRLKSVSCPDQTVAFTASLTSAQIPLHCLTWSGPFHRRANRNRC